jgi:hypothetical protein
LFQYQQGVMIIAPPSWSRPVTADADRQGDFRIFINYRREETAPYAGRLYDALVQLWSDDQVFIDIDTIPPGVDFVEVIGEAVGKCDVLIAFVGRHWADVTDQAGRRRLDNPEDFVRLELEAALARDVRVIPLLVDGAAPPASTDLPESLRPFARRNAFEISDTRWRTDVDRLAGHLRRVEAERLAKREAQRHEADEEAERQAQLEAERRETQRQAQLEAERLETERKGQLETEASRSPQRSERAAALIPGRTTSVPPMPPLVLPGREEGATPVDRDPRPPRQPILRTPQLVAAVALGLAILGALVWHPWTGGDAVVPRPSVGDRPLPSATSARSPSEVAQPAETDGLLTGVHRVTISIGKHNNFNAPDSLKRSFTFTPQCDVGPCGQTSFQLGSDSSYPVGRLVLVGDGAYQGVTSRGTLFVCDGVDTTHAATHLTLFVTHSEMVNGIWTATAFTGDLRASTLAFKSCGKSSYSATITSGG